MKPQKITMLNPDGTLQYVAFIVDSKKTFLHFTPSQMMKKTI